jgi:hypothetical protein
MKFISHRGNLIGKNLKLENNPNYVLKAAQLNFDVEIDVFYKNKQFYLGHDFAKFKVSKKFLENKKFWCHAKNLDALNALKKTKAHYFWHQNDDYTITSRGYFWTYPGKRLLKNSICVLPEKKKNKIKFCAGICSDNIEKYKKKWQK